VPVWRACRWAGAVSSWRGAMIVIVSGPMMQLRLDLAESPAPAVVLWELVGAEQRRAAMALLAALIARAVAGEEPRDELAPVRDPGAPGGRDD
jgi:hypothetical protein